jgi:hypothetical protein
MNRQSPLSRKLPERPGAPGVIASEAKFYISTHSFVCRVRRHWIILDVRSDQYYCIPAREFGFLGPHIHGWPSVAPEIAQAVDRHADTKSSLEAQLVAKGILTEDPMVGWASSPAQLSVPTSILDTSALPAAKSARVLLVSAFWLACARADRLLRRQTFESIVKAIEARRIKRSAGEPSVDPHRLRHLVAAFNALRLWYPRAYLCLFDSLALLEFLARQDIYPRWTFGVTADPFQAHCWLQDGSTVLNDSLSRVSGYTPIMSV